MERKGSFWSCLSILALIWCGSASALQANFNAPRPALMQAQRLVQGVYVNATELPTLSFLQRAQKSIDIEIYTMTSPAFRAALRAAMSRGVRIRVVKDPNPLGEKCGLFPGAGPTSTLTFNENSDCADQRKLTDEIRQAGGAFVPFNKANLCGVPGKPCFEHGKMILIDRGVKSNQAALISTGNFDPTNFCETSANPAVCNRDYSYITADPEIVTALGAIFDRDGQGQPYDVRGFLSGDLPRKITVSPFSQAPLVAFIRSAKKSVVIQNQYLHETEINKALVDVAKTGVKVYVQVASFCTFDKPDDFTIKKESEVFQAFDAAGIQTRIFTANVQVGDRGGYLHAKAIIVDGTYAWVGSVNGSFSATSQNREFGIFFNNPAMVNHLGSVMRQDFASPGTESWQESLQCAKDPSPRAETSAAN